MGSLSMPNPNLADKPLVTIAIPTLNRAAWIKDCVQTALAQSYPNFEVLVSDNASTDATAETLNSVSDRRLRVIRQKENIGLLPNWNACLAEARGEFIVFVSDDDRVEPWLLDRCATIFRREPRLPIVIALTNVSFVKEGRIQRAVTNKRLSTGIWDGTDILREYLEGTISTQMCGIVFRTEAIRAQGGFPLDFPHAADVACWASMLLAGKAGFVNEACATFSVHSAAQTSKFDDEFLMRDVRAVTELISARAENTVADQRKRRQIKASARYNVALVALYRANLRRKGGASLAEVFALLWHWRRDISNAPMDNALGVARQLTLLLLPAFATRSLRSLKATVSRLIAVSGRRRRYFPPV
jgi:glycosyltransferase involved in cell wall biosynthesis